MLSEKFTDLILTNMTDSVALSDAEGRFLYVNPATEKAFGLPKEQLVGKTPADLMREGAYRGPSTIEKVLATGQPMTDIVDHITYRRLSTSIPLLDEAGKIRFVLTSSRADTVLNRYVELLNSEIDLRDRYQKTTTYLSRKDISPIIYTSMKMKQIMAECRGLAAADGSICVSGESGVGKELIACYIHDCSPRAAAPFIPVNCSAVPPELFESEFFGYSPGAFTGAARSGKLGFVHMANKGTLFLDEIGELPLPMQSKLLRFLEDRLVQRVGSTRPEEIDVRIITATNRDLEKMVRDGLFREDLYYRLMVFPIQVPPLRERVEDIAVIADHFVDRFGKKYHKSFTLGAQEHALLASYPWPGNVRELRNVMERFVLLAEEDSAYRTLSSFLSAKVVPEAQAQPTATARSAVRSGLTLEEAVSRFQKQYIEDALEANGGNIDAAAHALGIHRSTLYRKRVSH